MNGLFRYSFITILSCILLVFGISWIATPKNRPIEVYIREDIKDVIGLFLVDEIRYIII